MLNDLDDRKRAVEKDPRSPGGQGYTGFEALLQYVFDQTMAINAFDSNGYMLKVNLFLSQCSDYQNLAVAEEEAEGGPELLRAVRGDPRPAPARDHAAGPELHRRAGDARRARAAGLEEAKRSSKTRPPKAPDVDDAKTGPERKAAEELIQNLEDTLGIDLPDLPPTNLPALRRRRRTRLPQAPSAADAQGLLDFLLAP